MPDPQSDGLRMLEFANILTAQLGTGCDES